MKVRIKYTHHGNQAKFTINFDSQSSFILSIRIPLFCPSIWNTCDVADVSELDGSVVSDTIRNTFVELRSSQGSRTACIVNPIPRGPVCAHWCCQYQEVCPRTILFHPQLFIALHASLKQTSLTCSAKHRSCVTLSCHSCLGYPTSRRVKNTATRYERDRYYSTCCVRARKRVTIIIIFSDKPARRRAV